MPLPCVYIAASLRAALRDLRSAYARHDVRAQRIALEQLYALIEEVDGHGAREREAANDG